MFPNRRGKRVQASPSRKLVDSASEYPRILTLIQNGDRNAQSAAQLLSPKRLEESKRGTMQGADRASQGVGKQRGGRKQCDDLPADVPHERP